jgi:hypothetical protein
MPKMTPDALTPDRATPSKEEKARAPHTRVKSGGRVQKRLRLLADMYIALNPQQGVRFVFHPENKPDLSNVTSRHIDGYRLVYVKDLGADLAEILPGMKPEDPVRVGDTVMMGIARDLQEEMRDDLDAAAVEERNRVQEEFYHSIDEVALDKGMKDKYRARPMGESVTELVEQEVEGPETHREP